MTYQGVFVDDQEEVWAEQLSTAGVLEFEFLPVAEVAELAHLIQAKAPLIVALDYRLDEAASALKPEQTYKGSALAQQLRDNAIESPASDFALVLVSAEAKVKALFKPDKTAHDLFDRVYIKEEVTDRRAIVRGELLSLANGYAILRGQTAPYDLVGLMKAEDADLPAIEGQELNLKIDQAKAPHVVVRIMLGLLIDRPGPLIDLDDVCAHLGVARDQAPIIEALVTDARYSGIFGDAWPRWWMHRLDAWSQKRFGRRPTGMPAVERARLLSVEFQHDLKPAESPWTGSNQELIAVACACCRRGVEIKHTVAVFEAGLPRFSTRRRICWDCVQSDAYENLATPLFIDEIDRDLAVEIKTMERPQHAGQAQ